MTRPLTLLQGEDPIEVPPPDREARDGSCVSDTRKSFKNNLLLQEEEPVEVPPEAVEQEMDLLLEVHDLLGLAPTSQLGSDLPSSWAAMDQTNLRWGRPAPGPASLGITVALQHVRVCEQHHKPADLQLELLFSTWLWQSCADQADGCQQMSGEVDVPTLRVGER